MAIVQSFSTSGLLFRAELDQRRVFEIYCHDTDDPVDLNRNTNITIFWRGSAWSDYLAEMFDKFRTIEYVRHKYRSSFLTARGIAELGSDLGKDLYFDEAILRNEPIPFSLPTSLVQLKIDFYGRAQEPNFEVDILSQLGAVSRPNLSFWGTVFHGPIRPSGWEDSVGVYATAEGMFNYQAKLESYMHDTLYDTASLSDINTLVSNSWKLFGL